MDTVITGKRGREDLETAGEEGEGDDDINWRDIGDAMDCGRVEAVRNEAGSSVAGH